MGVLARRLLVLAALLMAAPAIAAPCEPTAQVAGDATLAQAIVIALRARGVAVTDDAACREVIAQVEPDSERVKIQITDAQGRHIERVVEDVDGAATTIEAWVRRDISDPLVVANLPPRIDEAQPMPVATSKPVVVPERTIRIEVGTGIDGGFGGNRALWAGARVDGCAMLHGVCIGVVVRYALDTEVSGAAKKYANSRRGPELTLAVRRPFRFGRVTLAPGVGIGQMTVTASRIDPQDDELEEEDAVAFHGIAGVRAGYRIARAWSLHVDASILYAPTAETELGDTMPVMKPDGTFVNDTLIAASPKVLGWLGVGITYEGL